MSQQQPQFDWNQARKEIQCAHKAITEAKKDMIKLNVSIIESWYDCDVLQKELIQLLEKLEIQLQVYGKYIQFRSNQLKNNIQKSMLAKYLMSMNTTVQTLLVACVLVLGVSAALLCLEYGAFIATLSVGMRTGLKYALGISSGIGAVLIVGEIGYSLWRASKNKEKFEKAITATKQALSELERKKKDL